jgi:tRNA (guanine-N7-)-methyltransferase
VTTDPSSRDQGAAARAVCTTKRRGRMSDAKRDALATLTPRWGLTVPLRDSTLTAAFGRSAPRLLDVGVGTGEATRAWAAQHPDHDVVAVELHRPGLARLLQALDREGPANVRVLDADVTTLVVDLADPGREDGAVVHAVRVLFPDPWPKRRHRNRRLVDRAFVSTVADLLPPGGYLHLATDWDDYALQMRLALLHEPRLAIDLDGGLTCGRPWATPTTWTPTTRPPGRRPDRIAR